MIDPGIKMSDDRMRVLMNRIEETYTEAYKQAIKDNKKALEKFNALTDEALKGLTDEEKKKKREAFKNEVLRTEKLATKIADEITTAGRTASQIIQGELTGIYQLNYVYSFYEMEQQIGYSIDFTLYDRNQIAVILKENQSPFTKLAYDRLGQNTIVVTRLQNALIYATVNGQSQQQLTTAIRNVTGQSIKQARRVAQTERNAVQSEGRQLGFNNALEMGIELDKEWNARMFHTRESHENLHGKKVPANEKFNSILGEIEFPGDPNATAKNRINCFCYIKGVVRSAGPLLNNLRNKFDQKRSFENYLGDKLADKNRNW